MSDDDKLEVGLSLSLLDDHVERFGKGLNGVSIEICGGLVEGNDLRVC